MNQQFGKLLTSQIAEILLALARVDKLNPLWSMNCKANHGSYSHLSTISSSPRYPLITPPHLRPPFPGQVGRGAVATRRQGLSARARGTGPGLG